MCRGKDECTELADNTSKWDRYCPLRPPEWIDIEITSFEQAVDQLMKGNRDKCLELLANIKDEEITDWYIEHGQMSGRHRKNILGIPKPELVPEELRDSIRAPKKFQNAVFIRDGYRCRYCGGRLISQKFMKAFIGKLNTTKFMKGPNNLSTHGIIHATWPVADHVVPWNLGGRTNRENLVTSCGACNYGKDGYTCEQMGIDSPFGREPVIDSWDGLSSKVDKINQC